MSQSAFMGTLAAFLLAAAVIVWVYVYASADEQPAVRAVLTLGIPLAVSWVSPPGGHRAPWFYRPPPPSVPTVRAVAALPPATSILAITEHGEVLDAVLEPTAAAPLNVRVAEILAHAEADEHLPVPERTSEGATEDWSPTAMVTSVAIAATIVRSEPDAEERAILAAFDQLVGDTLTVPDWLADWGRKADATLEAAGLRSEPHRRWRAGALDAPTGELPRILLDA
jgi:hypothetical protein